MITRRRYMGGKKKEDFTLLYHWEASDELVNNVWIDRVQGVEFNAYNYRGKIDDMYPAEGSENNQRYFNIPNLNASIALPYRWKIEIGLYYPSSGNGGTSNSLYVLDFGSLWEATHNFGIAVTPSRDLFVNYKVFRNDNASTYGLASVPTIQADVLTTVTVGVEAYDTSKDILYAEYEGQKYYGKAPHAHTGYGAGYTAWYNNQADLGRGYYRGASYSKGICYIKSIRIYEDLR